VAGAAPLFEGAASGGFWGAGGGAAGAEVSRVAGGWEAGVEGAGCCCATCAGGGAGGGRLGQRPRVAELLVEVLGLRDDLHRLAPVQLLDGPLVVLRLEEGESQVEVGEVRLEEHPARLDGVGLLLVLLGEGRPEVLDRLVRAPLLVRLLAILVALLPAGEGGRCRGEGRGGEAERRPEGSRT
jgi:hypothetical protein